MITGIVGSRSIKAPKTLEAAIATSGFEITSVVTGGAVGVDQLAEAWSLEHLDQPATVFEPDYATHGRRAPLVRNDKIVFESQQIIAVWSGRSPGTKYTVGQARRMGVPLFVYKPALTRNGREFIPLL